MTTAADVIQYVNSRKSGSPLAGQQLAEFAKELAQKIGELSVKPPVEGADLILYDE